MLHEAADLIHRANQVNEELVAQARTPALAEIQRLLDSVGADLDKVAAAEDLRQKTTQPFNDLKERVATESDIAHINQHCTQAREAYEEALDAIEAAAHAPTPMSPTTPGQPTTSTTAGPTYKKRWAVDAKALWPGGFIETTDDMEEFLKKLRAELEAGLAAEKRIQIK
jgi:DNA repair exonuclease SbcCD ATPase subunit